MLANHQGSVQGARIALALSLVFVLVLPGCIESDRPPVSELEPPTWEIGQEWHYKGSNGQWRNWTVVGVEERRGFEVYRVQINLSESDKFGRDSYTYWFDKQTLGEIEQLKGETRNRSGALWGWGDKPIPPRFPFPSGNTSYSTNLTVFDGQDRMEFHVQEVVKNFGWVEVETGDQVRDVVHMRKVNPETNVREQYWYDPSVENWARYTADVESLTFNLTSWEDPR